MPADLPPVFRFAPSPNGALHLGHAYSALVNFELSEKVGGKFLLRIEDIDTTRCTPQLEAQMLEDLEWLGIKWAETPLRQSQHFSRYRQALETLRDEGLVYPSFMSRAQIKNKVAELENWPHDPDGSPHYPGKERAWTLDAHEQALAQNPHAIWRLDMKAALEFIGVPLVWQECAVGPSLTDGQEILVDAQKWGDVVLARTDTPTSYHLSVVIDDALQGITHVVRGKDLFEATSVHRVLQALLGLPAPVYHHHELILDDTGRKLSKSARDTSLRSLREAGLTPSDIRKMVGL